MALLHLAYERLLSAIHNENTLDLYFTLGRRLGRLLYEGKWFDPEAHDAARTRSPAGSRPPSPARSRSSCAAATTNAILDTGAQYMSYAPDKLSMERVEEPAFTPEDRIGALELQNLSVGDNRDLLLHHLDAVRALGAGRTAGAAPGRAAGDGRRGPGFTPRRGRPGRGPPAPPA